LWQGALAKVASISELRQKFTLGEESANMVRFFNMIDKAPGTFAIVTK
jgi:hypothetical protein